MEIFVQTKIILCTRYGVVTRLLSFYLKINISLSYGINDDQLIVGYSTVVARRNLVFLIVFARPFLARLGAKTFYF